MTKIQIRNKRDKKTINPLINETKFHRYVAHDLAGYERHVKNGGVELYSKKEIEDLSTSGVSGRLPPRATEHYMSLAANSEAITNLIKARPEEMADLSGEEDPSNQLKYSPISGLLHKYELALIYVVRTCSSWCRYCYRSDFLTSKTEKDIASVSEITEYIRSYNENLKKDKTLEDIDKHFIEADEEKFPIREVLLSGGDPMVLSNNNLFAYLDGLADVGIRTLRIGTKELAFFPERFDDNFFDMIDLFHDLHPDVNLAFMVHFSHADEFLLKDKDGNYITTERGSYKRIPKTENAIKRLRNRSYVTLENQAPIISGVNDDSAALRRLQIELKRLGINNHYFFQCREIEGHRLFAVSVEKAWKIHKNSQIGISGIEKSRFVMSTEYGKLEVVAVIDRQEFKKLNIPENVRNAVNAIFGQGIVILKAHRTQDAKFQGGIIIARRNPEALWISGYEDRILYDGRKTDAYSPMGDLLSIIQ